MSAIHRPRAWAVAVLAAFSATVVAGSPGPAQASTFPHYDHVFVVIDENHNYGTIIGNPAAPEINALANDYGLATSYTGVSDPSEPNYVAMLGGSDFGLNSDDPYFFPGNTVHAANLMSQLEGAGKTWKGYFQDMPYAGYRGYCYPAKCNGIPDSDTQYVAKHNGIPNFANMQTPAEFAKQTPLSQLSTDLATGSVPNLSYIVPDECNDMHGAPPWCVDSGKSGDVNDTWLVAQGDKFAGQTVNQITSSPVWASGNNAIVITFDEGNVKTAKIATVVVTNHGPRGVKDNTSYDHYSLLASLQQTFGLGCLLNSCSARTMDPLFAITGSSTTPALPAPFTPGPDGTDTISAQGDGVKGSAASLTCVGGWNVVPSPSIGNSDNNLAAVSAGSATDVWSVGSYYAPSNTNVLNTMGEHFDGTSWTEYPLPNVGPNENSLLGVSELPTGHAWAVGYFVNAEFQQQTLVEHYDGTTWAVVASPSPGARQNILYGVSAIADNDVWAAGAQQDASGTWHTLTEHYNGTGWSVVPAVDSGSSGNQFYAIKAVSSSSVYATGQQAGSGFPSQALVEHWNGSSWSALSPPTDTGETLTPYAITGNDAALTLAGDRESSTVPYTTMVAAGAPGKLALVASPNNGSGEQDLFAATTAADGTTWAAGWDNNGGYQTLVEQGVKGTWSLVASPSPGSGDNGFAGIAAVPGGGLWAVGVASGNSNFTTLTEYHC